MRSVAHLVDTLGMGGAQKLLVTFARTRPSDLPLTVINLRDGRDEPVAAELAAWDAQVLPLPGRGLADPARLVRLVSWLRQARPVVLHTHLTYSNILGNLAGWLAGVPVISSLHNAYADPRHANPMRCRVEGFCLKHLAHEVVAVGHAVAQAHQTRLGRTPKVVLNAVGRIDDLSPAEREAVRAALLGDPQRPMLISVGRLSPPKGYIDLLQAVARVRQAYPTVALMIAGSGAQQTELEALRQALGLQDQVYLLGQRDDVPRLLAAADLYVSASHWEGLPVAVLEAMAAGLPCVATSVGDVPFVLGPNTGVVVDPHQPEALAKAAIDLLSDPERRRALGAAGREHARRQYTPEAWLNEWFTIYTRAAGEPRAALPHMETWTA